MALSRRHFLWLTLAVAPSARAATTNLVLACDTTLAVPMRAAAAAFLARTGVRVHVFPIAPGLLLPQLRRDVQNDILVTSLAMLVQATTDGIVPPGAARAGPWRGTLVLAALPGAPADALDTGPVAVTDPTPASDIDGPAVLASIGLRPHGVLGAVDTDGVRFLLATGAARAGLVHATDLHGDPALEQLRAVPDAAAAPINYAAVVTRLSSRPSPDAFIKFLAGADASAILRANGLEPQP